MYIEQFSEYLRTERRYSHNTVQAYIHDINQFFEFAEDNTQIQELNAHVIRAWIYNLTESGIAPRSINRKLSALRKYIRYLQRESVLQKNPAIKITALKHKKSLPHYVRKEELTKMLDSGIFSNTFKDQRNQLILELFYMTGIRRSELIHLRLSDIDLDNGYLKVLGKGNKERLIPVTQRIKYLLNAYIHNRTGFAREIQTNEPYLFLTDKGCKMYPKLAYSIVNKYLALFATVEQKSPHTLRHSFATHMMNGGADINTIKELLGHANLSATQIYTHNSFEKVKSIYKQAHPRA